MVGEGAFVVAAGLRDPSMMYVHPKGYGILVDGDPPQVKVVKNI